MLMMKDSSLHLLPKRDATVTRIEYIDALRGFTMILVVLQHVALYCLNLKGVPSFHTFLIQVRMPMFFLISGFMVYKMGLEWNVSYTLGFLKKKFPVQIVSTLCFFLIYVHCKGFDVWQSLTNEFKVGYWFTYTLFLYYIFYSIIRIVFKKNVDLVVVLFAFLFYAIAYPPFYESIPLEMEVKTLLGISHWYYCFFFLLGTLFRKHFIVVQALMDNKYWICGCLLVYFLLNVYDDCLPQTGVIHGVSGLCKKISGICVLFSFFRLYQQTFSKKFFLGRLLQYIGTHTLDIYFLHYFLLPVQLSSVCWVFEKHPMPILELCFSLVISLIVIGGCLMIGNVIRLSPILAHWLLGAPRSNNA